MATQVNTNQVKDDAITPAKNSYIPVEVLAMVSSHSFIIDNDNSETNIFSYNVVGGTLGSTGEIRVRMNGYLRNVSGNPRNFTFKLKYGAETIATTTSEDLNSGEVGPFHLEANVAANAGSGAQVGGLTTVWADTSGNEDGVGWYDDGSAAQDSTGNLNLIITATAEVADADLELYLYAYEILFADPGS
jgi:hypothetical protein